MMTLITAVAIALTLQSNSTGNALTTDTTKSVQVFDIRNSEHYQRQNIQYSLAHFNKNGCDKNQYIHYSDRNLFKTLDEDLKK